MFITRAISSVIIVLLALVTILVGDGVLALTLLVISLVAFFELTKVMGVATPGKKINALECVGVFGILGYYLIIFFNKGETFIMLSVLLMMMGFMFVYVFAFPKFEINQVTAAFFSVLYAPVMLSFIFLTRDLENGLFIVWMIFISSWICDTCAYLVGIMIGKHKMAPKLSPKKSIEGAIGGIVGSAIVGAVFAYFFIKPTIEIPQIAVLFAFIGGVGAMISQIGDLAASAIKRNHNVKDYGKIIPGHGGIMDRFDSVILAAPMIYFLAVLLI